MSVNRVLSAATVATIGLTCKAFLTFGFCSSVTINGLHHLAQALHNEKERNNGKGVITVSNHISVLDDPLTWGILPTRYYFDSRKIRWALGASDIMFTNPVFSTFFRHGQVFETFRGRGIYQPSVDAGIMKLNAGDWVHLFGEGKVNQPCDYPPAGPDGLSRLPRFKWGTGRVLMEARHIPTVIPMWLSGFDQIMAEDRGFPRFLPRLGKSISVTLAPPISQDKLESVLDPWRAKVLARQDPNAENSGAPLGGLTGEEEVAGGEEVDKRLTRMLLTDVIQREVEALGRSVSGPLLGRRMEPPSLA